MAVGMQVLYDIILLRKVKPHQLDQFHCPCIYLELIESASNTMTMCHHLLLLEYDIHISRLLNQLRLS